MAGKIQMLRLLFLEIGLQDLHLPLYLLELCRLLCLLVLCHRQGLLELCRLQSRPSLLSRVLLSQSLHQSQIMLTLMTRDTIKHHILDGLLLELDLVVLLVEWFLDLVLSLLNSLDGISQDAILTNPQLQCILMQVHCH